MLTLSISYKICSGCKTEKPISGFYKNCSTKDGLHNWCKVCLKLYQKSEKGKVISKRSMTKYHGTIHGYLHRLFRRMLYRCYDPNYKGYKHYGGRGIKVCFKSADGFIDYVINKLQVDPRGLQIDRIDNDGNYESGNIRFVTCRENLMNRRCTKG